MEGITEGVSSSNLSRFATQICISYGDFRPDEALVYYGFLPLLLQQPPETSEGDAVLLAPPLPPPLFAIDERLYDSAARPGKVLYSQLVAGSVPVAALREEVARLESRLAEVAVEAGAAETACSWRADGLQPCDVRGSPGCSTFGRLSPTVPGAADESAGAAKGSNRIMDLVARLNQMRVAGLCAEISRVRAAVHTDEQRR